MLIWLVQVFGTWLLCICSLISDFNNDVVTLTYHEMEVIWHLLRRQLLRWWYLGQQRVRIKVIIGFLVWDRAMIKIRVRVGVSFNVGIYHRSNCRRSNCTFEIECDESGAWESMINTFYKSLTLTMGTFVSIRMWQTASTHCSQWWMRSKIRQHDKGSPSCPMNSNWGSPPQNASRLVTVISMNYFY